MKFLLIAFALLAATQAASLKRKSFQENYQDFNVLIMEEVGEELFELFQRYEDELVTAFSYLINQDFAQLIAEMETIPDHDGQTIPMVHSTRNLGLIIDSQLRFLEHVSAKLIDFIEEDGIEIHFYIALLHEALGMDPYEYLRHSKKSDSVARQSGDNALSRYLNELISLLPAEKLRSLYEEKIATDDEFRVTMENLQSQEFADLWNALLANEVFQGEVARLLEHDIDIEVLVDFLLATLGLLNA